MILFGPSFDQAGANFYVPRPGGRQFNIASEASYVSFFKWTKVNQKWQKCSILASFLRPETCGQTVLPDRSILIEQNLVEDAKIKKFQIRHFG